MLFKKDNLKTRNKLIEHCAIFGVTCDDIGYSVSQNLYKGLMILQHRGQESSGISILQEGGKIFTYKKTGLVSKVLTNHQPKSQKRK